MQSVPDPGRLPVAQPSPAGHAAAAAQFQRQHAPGDAALEHEQDAGQRGTGWHPGPAAFRIGRWIRWQEWRDHSPQLATHKWFGHVARTASRFGPQAVMKRALSTVTQLSRYS